ncbi:MAG TPA: carboxypeptidase regulatory-like domain-containing protein [Terriglobales bacterium]|nr:carboxypeptidase regulatory-like domain-containing protein [Terriglobales bacterium]
MINRNKWTVLFALLVFLSSAAAANTLTGTVTNGTSHKPSAGDDVILIKLAAGMQEAGRTKTDAQGKFSIPLPDDGMHLIRVVHQGVTYHQPAPPGTTTADVEVYDANPKVAGVKAVADLMYIQAGKGDLAIMRLFAVDNTSQPPRTQMNDADFEFYAPENAEIEDAQAQTAGGQWVNTQPVPQREKGRYAFVFPLRPGQTQFRVTYHLPYSGKASLDPKLIYPLQHFVTIMPRSLGFTPSHSGVYEDKQPPDLPDAIAEVASSPKPGQNLAFEISGEGSLQDQSQNASNQGGSSGAASTSADNRPGGGLGKPGDDPDPMDQYRWWLLGIFGVVLAGGAVYITSRSKSPAIAAGPTVRSAPSSAPLLDALKEELFQLELEHQQDRISDQEYSNAKAALDQTLARALRRNK